MYCTGLPLQKYSISLIETRSNRICYGASQTACRFFEVAIAEMKQTCWANSDFASFLFSTLFNAISFGFVGWHTVFFYCADPSPARVKRPRHRRARGQVSPLSRAANLTRSPTAALPPFGDFGAAVAHRLEDAGRGHALQRLRPARGAHRFLYSCKQEKKTTANAICILNRKIKVALQNNKEKYKTRIEFVVGADSL